MSEVLNRGTALGFATGTMLALGGLVMPAASAEAKGLNNAGPNLPSNLAEADYQLHAELDEEGPNSCLAIEIGQSLGINTETGRASYLTSGNISLIKKVVATNAKDPGEVGCTGQTPVKVANTQSRSPAYTIAAIQVPAASNKYVQKTKAGYMLKNAVIRQAGENALLGGVAHLPKKRVSNTTGNIDVSYGVTQAVKQYAAQEASSISADSAPACPGGSESASSTNAEISAMEGAAAHEEALQAVISGGNTSFTTFQTDFNEKVLAAEAIVKAAADGSLSCTPNAPPTPPATTTPTTPPPTTTTPPPPPPPPPTGPYKSGDVGVDISWPQCGTADAQPTGAQFGIVGVTDGLGYSTNPCLSEEAANFTGNTLSLYVNTGWNSASSHINPNSPRSCATGDNDCLAYNYGYNAGEYAYEAAASLGVSSPTWWLDVESNATWSTDPVQNQNSLQGEHDALIANGATTVGPYSTTVQWDDITGSWVNNWPSWGATTWTTAKDAATYCMGHQFTGSKGPSYLMQFQGTDPKTGNQIDQNVAC